MFDDLEGLDMENNLDNKQSNSSVSHSSSNKVASSAKVQIKLSNDKHRNISDRILRMKEKSYSEKVIPIVEENDLVSVEGNSDDKNQSSMQDSNSKNSKCQSMKHITLQE